MRILIADDHALVRDTIGAFLSREADLDCEGADTLDDALGRIRRSGRFDLVLLDYAMPGVNGLDGVRRVTESNGERTVAVLSGIAPRRIAREALAAGAIGFVPKTLPARSLLSAVRFMLAGEAFAPVEYLAAGLSDEAPNAHLTLDRRLSRREAEVLGALGRGLANKEIAAELGLAEVTVKLHVRTLCRKLGARNRTHAVVLAQEAGRAA